MFSYVGYNMIDLHLHLDGSLSKEDYIYLAKLNNYDLTQEELNNRFVSIDCPSLKEYLKCFDLPLKLLQTKESIEYAFYSLSNRLYDLGFLYAEIRFAPGLHLNNDLTMEEVVSSAVNGVKKALINKQNFNINIILCLMRHFSLSLNMKTVEVAHKFKNDKVVAIDLAGDESLTPASSFKSCFELAKKYDINITIHAGEATGSEEVSDAINLGAKRIGHGVHYELNDYNVSLAKDKKIGFEVCPTSNIQTKSIKSYKDNPILEFLRKNVLVTLNSDNMTVSNTDVYKEFAHLMNDTDISKDEMLKLLFNAAEMSFISKQEKEKLEENLFKNFDSFYNKCLIEKEKYR